MGKSKLEKRADKATNEINSLARAQGLFKRAEELAKVKAEKFSEDLKKTKDGQFHLTILKTGTMSDKSSALVVLIQRSPIATLPYLLQIVAQCKKPARKVAEQSILCMKDLLLGESLLEKSKTQLLSFTRNPVVLKHSDLADDLLLECYLEHCLREIIKEFLSVLAALSKNDLEHFRNFSLDITAECMKCWSMVESTQQAVTLLTNKFGDKVTKI